MKKFLFLKICLLTLYSPIIFAITCSTGSGGGGSLEPGWSTVTSSVAFPARSAHSSVVFDEKIWVIGGGGKVFDNKFDDAWSSADGKTWKEVTKDSSRKFSARDNHASVVFDKKMWVIGGTSSSTFFNDVWSSDDGKNWTQVKAHNSEGFSGRTNHAAVVFDDGKGEKMWVLGGTTGGLFSSLNDVWSSTDGKTWKEETKDSSKKFSTIRSHKAVVFDDDGKGEKMWLIGGINNNNPKAEIWNSTNGVTWNKVTDSAKFGVRFDHQSVVFDEKMWVINGRKSDGSLGGSIEEGDAWTSGDGATWNESDGSTQLLVEGREAFSSVAFDGKIWMIGGIKTGNITLNDVWRCATSC
jgi:hypothetical protein